MATRVFDKIKFFHSVATNQRKFLDISLTKFENSLTCSIAIFGLSVITLDILRKFKIVLRVEKVQRCTKPLRQNNCVFLLQCKIKAMVGNSKS